MNAARIQVRGVVQGVGFRPFVYRLAHRHGLRGWVVNDAEGVEIHLEGAPEALDAFERELRETPPPAARIAELTREAVPEEGHAAFVIRESDRGHPTIRPTVRISPDLPVCAACLAEMRDPADRRHGYPYINCTDCGPRYSIVLELPYDRPATTMAPWPLCPDCEREYHDPLDRRFHAQPVACPVCGPRYRLHDAPGSPSGDDRPLEGDAAVVATAARLRGGAIVAIKGIGGYHLACDARHAAAVATLRERKFRKAKPFALMVRDLAAARALITLSAPAEALLTSSARPIVLAPARAELPGVAPGNRELGVMLPYAPLHELLFERGAPEALVLTSANRSSEPIAYRDDDAFERLAELADAFLVGERPIARRVDDSVARDTPFGPAVLRRSRGYAPGAVAALPTSRPLVAVGADLKNSVAVAVGGQVFGSQHVGDLDHWGAFEAFRETIDDLSRMYDLDWERATVVHDAHPSYRSREHALALPAARHLAVQHHRAHVASVLAERGAWEARAVGVAFDGTGYGDDGAIWGGEFFVGSVATGFERAAHLRPAALPGGDAAARFPPQAAAGFLAQMGAPPPLDAPPFELPERYRRALRMVAADVRTFPTTSAGRLFDTVAALLGFHRPIAFEGQAAIWLEHLARHAPAGAAYPLPFDGAELDFRPLLEAVLAARRAGHDRARIARAFHAGVAEGIVRTAARLCEAHATDLVALSGGVFQNELLLHEIHEVAARTEGSGLRIWTQRNVPPNDGGIALGQIALGAFATPSTL